MPVHMCTTRCGAYKVCMRTWNWAWGTTLWFKTRWILSSPRGPHVLVNGRLGYAHDPSQNRGQLGLWGWIITHLAPPLSHFYPQDLEVKQNQCPALPLQAWSDLNWAEERNEAEQGSICHGLVLPGVLRVWSMIGDWIRNFQVERHKGDEKPDEWQPWMLMVVSSWESAAYGVRPT